MKKYLSRKNIILVSSAAVIWFGLSFYARTLCWIRALFGIPCPGCGSTRALFGILRGDIVSALRYHPLIFVSFAAILYFAAGLFTKKFKFPPKAEKRISFALISLYIGLYIIRMILFFPHTEPMTILDSALWQRIFTVVWAQYGG